MKKKTLIFRCMCFRDREKRPEGSFFKGKRERTHPYKDGRRIMDQDGLNGVGDGWAGLRKK